jgi:putative polyketide hydroxylase
MQASSQLTVPVLIIGGGIVGLSTALFLAERGVRALVVEKHAGTAIHPRARGFHPPTVELFARSGVAETMIASSPVAPRRTGMLTTVTLAGPALAWQEQTAQPDSLLSPCPLVFLGQDRIEPLVLAAARARGAEVRFGARMLDFEPQPDGVVARIDDGTRVHARYLVAADGARSPVREALGIAREGRGVLGHQASTLMHADLSRFFGERPFGFATIAHAEAGGVVVVTDVPHRWIYATRFDPGSQRREDFTPAEWQRRFRLAAGVPDLPCRAEGTFVWELAERVATRLQVGRVFLAGDAAHQMPPSGGWGANTGIQDAANLAWKLAAVLHGEAAPTLLDSYDRERRPVARAIAHQALLLALRMQRVAFDEAELCDDDAVVYGIAYGSSEPIPRRLALTGEPGTRAPHVPLASGRSTRQLFGAGFVLLASDARWRAADVHVEQHDGWQDAYGVDAAGAALVRPDGFVAARWRTLPADPQAEVGRALADAHGGLTRCG